MFFWVFFFSDWNCKTSHTPFLTLLFINLFIQSLRQTIVRTEKCTITAGVPRVQGHLVWAWLVNSPVGT